MRAVLNMRGMHRHAGANERRPPGGYTLFEVLLVLAILVAVGTIATPIFTKSFEQQRLMKAGDALRTAWSKARLQAMTTGQTHVFRFDYGAGQFVTALWDTGDAAVEASGDAAVTERTGKLPDGVTFFRAEKVVDARTAQTEGAGGQTAPQLYFYPDGTTSTAQVLLANNNARYLKVELRGLTGVPKVGEVISAAELER
jgi:Tfp pilus assembly protein FimT